MLLHAATAVLLFLVLRQMTGATLAQRAGGGACSPSIPARGIGGLGGRAQGRLERIVFHARPLAPMSAMPAAHSRLCVTLVVLLFALGLMAKPMLVTLPSCLLLLDYWPLGRLAISVPERGALVLVGWVESSEPHQETACVPGGAGDRAFHRAPRPTLPFLATGTAQLHQASCRVSALVGKAPPAGA